MSVWIRHGQKSLNGVIEVIANGAADLSLGGVAIVASEHDGDEPIVLVVIVAKAVEGHADVRVPHSHLVTQEAHDFGVLE